MKNPNRQKNKNRGLRAFDNSGIIIIVVLWILVILTLLSVGLGQRTRMELSLTRHSVGQFKSKYLAWAGLIYTMKQIRKDSESEETKEGDTLYQCGVDLEGKGLESVFSGVPLDGGAFTVSFLETDTSGNKRERLGFRDEERRINLNAITVQNYKVLKNLIVEKGFSEEDAQTVAASVIDWKDDNSKAELPDDGAEDEYYSGLEVPYQSKDLPFDSVEELLLVRGVTQDMFDAIKDDITIYPKQGNLVINFNTASKTILRAAALSVNNVNVDDAESMIEKILLHRAGDDGEDYTADDNEVNINNLGLNQAERAIFLNMQYLQTRFSNYFRVTINGLEDNSTVPFTLEDVVARN